MEIEKLNELESLDLLQRIGDHGILKAWSISKVKEGLANAVSDSETELLNELLNILE